MAADAHSVECDALVVNSHDQPRQALDRVDVIFYCSVCAFDFLTIQSIYGEASRVVSLLCHIKRQ